MRRCVFATLLSVVAAAHGAAQCPSGHRAVLEGSGVMTGGTIRQLLHLRKPASEGYDGEWTAFRFEQTTVHDRPHPQNVTQTVQDKAADGTPITTRITMVGNETRVVMEGKLARLIAAAGHFRHHQGGVAEGEIAGHQISFRWLPPPNPMLAGTITNAPDPVLRVTPETDFVSAGPHTENRFKPATATYTLTNCDDQPITYAASTTAQWIAVAPAGGAIAPQASVAVSISLTGDFKRWDEGTVRERVEFRNVTTSRGDTNRHAELRVKPHRWHVLLTGHETDYKAASGKIRPGERLDVRFQYAFQGTFEIGKKNGRWIFQNSVGTAADLKLKPIVVPDDWWNFKPPVCVKCAGWMKGLIGKPIYGILHPPGEAVPDAVQLNWGPFFPRAHMWVQMKPHVACTPLPQCKSAVIYQGTQMEYGSDVFHQRIAAPEIPLKEGPHPYSPVDDADRLRFVYTLKRLE